MLLIMTSLEIFKRIAESTKKNKMIKMKTRMKRIIQLLLFFTMMLLLFFMMVMLILHVRIRLGLWIQLFLSMLHLDEISPYPTLLLTLAKLGLEIKGWLVL